MSDAKDDGYLKGRREFLRNPFKRTLEDIDERRRTGHYRLNELREMLPEDFNSLKPKVFPSIKIGINEGVVQATIVIDLFPVGDNRIDIFNHFNGKTRIDQITRKIAAERGISKKEAHELVRALFLELVEKQICYPAEAPEW